jgi:hypothetical protein
MTTTTLTKGSDGRDCGAWCPPCSGAAQYGDPLAAFDPLTEGIRNFRDAGNTVNMGAALAALAVCLDRLECYESAATIAGFAFNALTAAWITELGTAIAHLRDVLGE